jgi:arylsulfatase
MLNGRNHHSNGMACITEGSTGFPGSNGAIPFENGFLSEMLLPHGYATFCVGKWHLTPAEQISAAGPYDRWPLGRGFDRYYGFLGGDTHQYYPDLVFDNHQVEPPKTPEEGYHLTVDLADKAIEFIADLKQVAPDKPFFLYFATGANHAPHQVPKEWADKYKGKFDAAGTPIASGCSPVRRNSESLPRTPCCRGTTRTCSSGTSSPMTSADSMHA